VIDDIDEIKHLKECKSSIQLIVNWCMDDNGLNILYKTNGAERYPDFKLYKMIARSVHKHIPKDQLQRPEFKKFNILKKNLPSNIKAEFMVNIDNIPCMHHN